MSASTTETEDALAGCAADTCGSSYLTESSQRAFLRQLARIQGHVGAIGKMVEQRACADDILLQVTAVKGAMSRFAAILVEEELKSCMSSFSSGCEQPDKSEERLDRLTRVLATILKQT